MATAITGDLLPRQSIAIRDRLRAGNRNGTRAGTMQVNLAGRMAGDAKARETIIRPALIVRPVRSRDRPPRPPAQPRHPPREAGARRNTHHDTGCRRWTSRARRPNHLRASALLHQEGCVARTATARGEGRKIDSADANRAATLNTPEHIVIAIFPATHPEITRRRPRKRTPRVTPGGMTAKAGLPGRQCDQDRSGKPPLAPGEALEGVGNGFGVIGRASRLATEGLNVGQQARQV